MENKVLTRIREYLPGLTILEGDSLQQRFFHIWHMDEPLSAMAVLLPSSTEEVSLILKCCNEERQRVVVHGGLTGLVGATMTTFGDLVISMERMNTIEEVDVQSRTMTVGAGVILEDIQNIASSHDLLFPVNFGARGSAQIGGVISTNAGGLRVLRYGMTRNLVLGLEVVLADGTVVSSMKKIIKDNSGYDLKQIFIGAEGTLGVITRAILKLVESPRGRVSALAGLRTYEDVVTLLKFLDRGMAGTLSAFELLWENAYRALTSPPSLVKPPLPYDHTYYVLVEGLGADTEKDLEQLQNLMDKAMREDIIQDAVFAGGQEDLAWFWRIREDVSPLLDYGPSEQSFDISLPVAFIGPVINDIADQLKNLEGVLAVFSFGHVADGNIHFIILKESNDPFLTEKINEIVYHPLEKVKGSVSAEHGIGIYKKSYFHLSRSGPEIELMRKIKRDLDPNNILNRGRIFD